MPNCDFYATPDDHRGILEWIFADGSCEVYELASEFEKPLRCFKTPEEVLGEFDRVLPNGKKQTMVLLQLYVIGAGPPFLPTRVGLDSKECGGATFRYCAEGWGLIQLYLGSLRDNLLEDSHTNHNTRRRAETWASTYPEFKNPDAWDFDKVSSYSFRLNREIRKRRVGKIRGRPILPGGMQIWDAGLPLWPYKPGEHELTERKAQATG
jgi:hypothetical protein